MSDAYVFTPKTRFALMPQEPTLDVHEQYRAQYQQDSDTSWIVLDGPPYANGNIHIGHVLNKVQKDLSNQIAYKHGHRYTYIQGSDCHGLPIEKAVEKKYGAGYKHFTSVQKRAKCREFAEYWIVEQNKQFADLGVFCDTRHFKTMDSVLDIIERLHIFARRGQIYQGYRPIMWSVTEQTSMADAEIEYKDHTSTAIDVPFNIISSDFLPADAKCVIWTTTVWTIPANQAIAYHPDLEYVLVDTDKGKFVVAHALLEAFLTRIDVSSSSILKQFPGSALANTVCSHPLREYGYTHNVPLLSAGYVTATDGTGLVHTAPDHGEEDFQLGQKHNLPLLHMVGPDGILAHVPVFAGMHISKVTTAILEILPTLSSKSYHHSYPYSWRSDTPLIYRTTQQWYFKLNKELGIDFANQIHWIPKTNRFVSMLANRGDWCISRQRIWGTPLALFTKDEQAVFDPRILDCTLTYLKQHGVDSWFTDTSEQILSALDLTNAADYIKTSDTLDVWFDAGAMQYCMRDLLSFPVDLYLEGSDQHRGFFQACLLQYDELPVRNIMTHGFVLDGKGKKMSKSTGNVIDPQTVIAEYGIDVLRLYIATVDCTDDVRYSKQQMDKAKLMYKRFRNCIRYCLSCLEDVTTMSCHNVDTIVLDKIHAGLLHKFYALGRPDPLHWREFYLKLYEFCEHDLSNVYFDINKDSLYCDPIDHPNRQQILHVYRTLAYWLIEYLAPVLKHMTCELNELLGNNSFITRWSERLIFDDALVAHWECLQALRTHANAHIEQLRAAKIIAQASQAAITVHTSAPISAAELAYVTLTAQATVVQTTPDTDTIVHAQVFDGTKCQRCRKYYYMSNTVCQRCSFAHDVV